MHATTIGLDLAKHTFSACIGDAHGHFGQSQTFTRTTLLSWLKRLPAGTVIAMEACGTAHFWGRTMQAMGLTPRLIAADFVKPYRKNQRIKNDARDAEAILAALHAPKMRFVTVKTEAQQQRLLHHRLREGWKQERTGLICRIRGLLAELGILIDPGAGKARRKLAELAGDPAYPADLRASLQSVLDHLRALDARIEESEQHIERQSQCDPQARCLRTRPGIGLLTADAVLATVGDARQYKNGRQFAASLGITPRQHGTGGKTHLGCITRRGDPYLRSLFVQGARCVLQAALRIHAQAPERLNRLQQWMVRLHERVGYHKAAVAIANKHARQVWAMLARGEAYNSEAWREWEAAHGMVETSDQEAIEALATAN